MTRSSDVARIGQALFLFGGEWMAGPVMQAGQALGLEPYPWPFYLAGRCGVLGPVDADVVAAALAFQTPQMVRPAWDAGRALQPLQRSVAQFIGCGYDWARTRFADAPGLGRFIKLTERAVDSLPVAGAPLAMGWRAIERPADPPARTVHLAHILREHRAEMHVAALLTLGVPIPDAIVATPGEGAGLAEMYLWPPPFADLAAAQQAKEPAERATNQMALLAYDSLSDDELTELADISDELNKLSVDA